MEKRLRRFRILFLICFTGLFCNKLQAQYQYWSNTFDSSGSTATITDGYQSIISVGQGVIGQGVNQGWDAGFGYVYTLENTTIPEPVTDLHAKLGMQIQ